MPSPYLQNSLWHYSPQCYLISNSLASELSERCVQYSGSVTDTNTKILEGGKDAFYDRGEIYDQDDNKQTITVMLYVDNGIDILEFNLGDGKVHKLDPKSEDNQDAIKSMFCDLILLVEASSIELTLDVDQSYDNALLKEVANSYISDLNGELEAVRTEITTPNDDETE